MMNAQAFLKRYADLGVTFDPGSVRASPCLRVNTLKIAEGELRRRLEAKGARLLPVPFLPDAFFYEASFSLGATPEYLLGYYYLQDAASQLPALVLAPRPGDRVLDMAASPGGKTTQMAALMRNEGVIAALDINPHRLGALRNNCERLGIKNVVMYKKDARFSFDLKQEFDKVLLDAPCSGNFCIEPGFFDMKTLQGVVERSRLQKELFKAAVKVLRIGGTLVYSTCSLEPEEDELLIAWAIAKYPELELLPAGIPDDVGDSGVVNVFGQAIDPVIAKTRRFWPHKTGTEGFFIAKFIKRGDSRISTTQAQTPDKGAAHL